MSRPLVIVAALAREEQEALRDAYGLPKNPH
jgi:hypothetical protein